MLIVDLVFRLSVDSIVSLSAYLVFSWSVHSVVRLSVDLVVKYIKSVESVVRLSVDLVIGRSVDLFGRLSADSVIDLVVRWYSLDLVFR